MSHVDDASLTFEAVARIVVIKRPRSASRSAQQCDSGRVDRNAVPIPIL